LSHIRERNAADAAASQFELRRLYARERSLVPLVKTQAFGMTPLGNLALWK
jgi:hypothetical protein